VIPARPRKPRDKAKVQAAVLIAERWIIAVLLLSGGPVDGAGRWIGRDG